MRITLVLSLVANVVLIALFAISPRGASVDDAHASADTAVTTSAAPCASCDEELRRCRADAFAGISLPGPRSSTKEEPRDQPASSPSPSTPDEKPLVAESVDVELQADVLCEIARTHLRDHWDRERENLMRAVRHGLSDEQQLAKSARETVKRFAGELGLSAADERRLAERYLPLREARLAKAHEQVTRELPDLDGLYRTARGLYAAEDALVEELFGAEAKQRLRLGEAEPRTAILAIVASLAGVPWTEVEW